MYHFCFNVILFGHTVHGKIDVQYSQRAIFSIEKGLIGQNHSSLGSHRLVKISPPAKFPISPTSYQYLERHAPLSPLPFPILLFGFFWNS